MFGLVFKRKTFSRGASFSFLDSAVWTLSDQGSTPWSRDGGLEPSFLRCTWKLKCWFFKTWRFLFLCPLLGVKLGDSGFWKDILFTFSEFQNVFHFGGVGRGRVEWFRFQVCGYPTEDYFAVQCQWRHPMLWGIRKSRWMCGEWMR